MPVWGDSNLVFVVNGTTNKVVTNVTVGNGPDGAAFDSTNGYVYISNYFNRSVSVINGATNGVIDTISNLGFQNGA